MALLCSNSPDMRLAVLLPCPQDLDRLRALPADDERYKEIPAKYHLAYPLDDEKARGIAGAFGYPSVVYKVTGSLGCRCRSQHDGTERSRLSVHA